MIVSSFAEQYGVRLEVEDISWPEYYKLLGGLSGETALGRTVSIRSEKDRSVIKNFTSEQKKVRRDWINKQQEKNPDSTAKYLNSLDKIFKSMFVAKE